jgi:hypothetical protein
MLYQLTWKTLPGMRGLYCEEFRATETTAPDNERGVAVEFLSEAERDAFLRELETHFAPQRFSNNAAAFEAVKSFVLERCQRRSSECSIGTNPEFQRRGTKYAEERREKPRKTED